MPAFRSNDLVGSSDEGGWSVRGILRLALASVIVSLVVTLFARRYSARMGPAGALPAPPSIRQPQAPPPASANGGTPASGEAPAGEIEQLGRAPDERLEAGDPAPATSPLGAVAEGLTTTRTAALERLLADPDVVAGDGSDACPAEFSVKGNGRSGIYHQPGAFAYGITQPTLCFRSAEAAERAGFRPAKR